MHVYYTDIKRDSYSQFSVDTDLVGVGALKVGMAFHWLCTQLYYNPSILKFLDPPLVLHDKQGTWQKLLLHVCCHGNLMLSDINQRHL